ncbi:hypothetical protein [Glaciimonas sp. PAMC28666]|uniref:hypothetical protein n=1 Tax=Glaciimonas sp. PAMC28666 TaxID=2807626 RepID=UPI00196290DC|nr:hypothetical protein [Glaciimonas sp. PAMC28666]QRX82413.1 hypothetical protein JQN73_20395 [Glaciimonas sp. PAMC28666]
MLVPSLAAEGVEVAPGAIAGALGEGEVESAGAGAGVAGVVSTAGAVMDAAGDESAADESPVFLQPTNKVAMIMVEIIKGLVNIFAPCKDGLVKIRLLFSHFCYR